jgi:hypothetical protein
MKSFMRFPTSIPGAALVLSTSVWLTGCGESDSTTTTAPTDSGTHADHDDADHAGHDDADHGHGHGHDGDDALVWGSTVEHAGFQLQLGHHSTKLFARSRIEPAVGISKDGAAVGDAQVFNALVATADGAVLAAEVPTVYKPESADEPAHYAQGGLSVPANATDGIIRFRIVFPGDAGEQTFDLPVKFEPAAH